jgi:GNAT superfamily N-acetyltransferase
MKTNASQPTFQILTPFDVTAAIDHQMDRLYRVAFDIEGEGTEPNPEAESVEGNSPFDWFVLGWTDSQLVAQLALLRREIRVGAKKIWVAGVAGVATHPDWRHRGFASSLLLATQDLMCRDSGCPFGLLVCKDELRPLYERSGWKYVADGLTLEHEGGRSWMETSVMVFSISEQDWPTGEIDLCGSSW